MKKYGFTLVELLAVIAILGVLAVITVPVITKTIDKAKKDAFQENVNRLVATIRVEDANQDFDGEKLYQIFNGTVFPKIESSGSVEGTGIVAMNEDGKIKVEIENDKYCVSKTFEEDVTTIKKGKCNGIGSYAMNGLVAWYDGEYNGGFETHVASTNTWKNLLLNGKDATMTGATWNSKSLQFGASTSGTAVNPLAHMTTTKQTYTVELVFKVPVLADSMSPESQLSGINFGTRIVASPKKALNYINNGTQDYYIYSKNLTPENKRATYTYLYEKDGSLRNYLNLYLDGVVESANNFEATSKPSGTYAGRIPRGMAADLTFSMKNMELYSVRIYDRLLTEEEIINNARIDALRF